MKCPKCAAICADTDRTCYSCRSSLRGGGGKVGTEKAGRVATAFACIGAFIAPAIADSYAPKRPQSRGGINWTQVHYAGVGGAVGGVLGMVVGSMLFVRKE